MNRFLFAYWTVVATCFVGTYPGLASAYIGPGAGLSAIGAFLALVVAVVLAIIGFLWFPIKRLLRSRQQNAHTQTPSNNRDKSPTEQPGSTQENK